MILWLLPKKPHNEKKRKKCFIYFVVFFFSVAFFQWCLLYIGSQSSFRFALANLLMWWFFTTPRRSTYKRITFWCYEAPSLLYTFSHAYTHAHILLLIVNIHISCCYFSLFYIAYGYIYVCAHLICCGYFFFLLHITVSMLYADTTFMTFRIRIVVFHFIFFFLLLQFIVWRKLL